MGARGRHRQPRRGSRAATVVALVAVVVAVGLLSGFSFVRAHRAVRADAPAAVDTRARFGSAPATSGSTTSPSPTEAPSPGPSPSPSVRPVPKPKIVWDPIPFPAARKRQMAAYARLHYGIDSWRLVHPRVIVEHYTASTTFPPVWNTFANDVPDPEFHSLPADCAHFVIDRNGTIYQLVPLSIMCRHTVGLNYTAIGIEMVGMSDAQILSDHAELRSAIHLTAWLMQRFGIQRRNVIGHNESLDSPYHRELVAAWRCQTHGDWRHADMRVFRSILGRDLRAHGIPLGPPWRAHLQAGC